MTGYPTLKIFRKGKDSAYNGPRDHDGIVKYMKKQAGPSAKPLSTKGEVEQFIDDPDVSIVGFFSNTEERMAREFVETANSLREQFRFAIVADKSVAKALSVDDSSIVMFRPFEEKKVVYNGSPNLRTMTDWIYMKSIAFAGEITKDNQERYFRR